MVPFLHISDFMLALTHTYTPLLQGWRETFQSKQLCCSNFLWYWSENAQFTLTIGKVLHSVCSTNYLNFEAINLFLLSVKGIAEIRNNFSSHDNTLLRRSILYIYLPLFHAGRDKKRRYSRAGAQEAKISN